MVVDTSQVPSVADLRYYRWTFPGAPIRIDIALDVVSGLSEALDRTPVLDIARFAGVLTSSAEQGSADPTHVSIDGFVEIPFDPGPDGAAAFEPKLREFSDQSGAVSPVGSFLALRDEFPTLDAGIEVITGHRIPGLDIVLRIAVLTTGERVAGFRFLDADALTPFSLMDFPLDAGLLLTREKDRRRGELARRTSQVHGRVDSPANPQSENGGGHHVAPIGTVAGAKQRTRQQRFVVSTILLALGTLAVVSAVVALLVLRSNLRPNPGQPQVRAASVSPVELQVEAQANGLNLVWKTDVPAVDNAASAQMLITEQNQVQRVIDLDPQLLRNGRVFYVPSSERVRICLELKDSKSQVTSACTMALLTVSPERPASSGKAPVIGQPPAQRSAAVGEAARTPPEPKFRVQSQTLVEPAQGRENSIQPAPPSASREETAAAPAPAAAVPQLPPAKPSPEAPRPAENVPQTAASNPEVAPPIPTAAPAIPTAAPAVTPASNAAGEARSEATPVRVSSTLNYKRPVARFESLPKLDPVVRSMLLKDTQIEVKVSIDETGRVVRAEAVGTRKRWEGHLEQAAISAARRWVFVPAQSNGKSIPSEHLIQFMFRK